MIKRLPKPEEQTTFDNSDGTHTGFCRACGLINNCISNDSGYCQDCD